MEPLISILFYHHSLKFVIWNNVMRIEHLTHAQKKADSQKESALLILLAEIIAKLLGSNY